MLVRLADLNIRIENRYPYLEKMCARYTVPPVAEDFSVSVSDSEILAEEAGREMPGYAESLAVYRKIAEEILLYDGFLMHGAVIETDGEGVAFLAKSGVGKTTHMARWKMYLGDKMQVVNGDKPLIRFTDGVPYAYGTPWAGKEKLETNMRVPLKTVCFLSRSEKNEAVPCKKEDVFMQLLPQIYLPKDGEKMGLLLEKLNRFIESVSFYSVGCSLSPDAGETVYRAIFK